jgi:hypothetical protein
VPIFATKVPCASGEQPAGPYGVPARPPACPPARLPACPPARLSVSLKVRLVPLLAPACRDLQPHLRPRRHLPNM